MVLILSHHFRVTTIFFLCITATPYRVDNFKLVSVFTFKAMPFQQLKGARKSQSNTFERTLHLNVAALC